MTILDRITRKSKNIAAFSKREIICAQMRERLENENFSIISSNCIIMTDRDGLTEELVAEMSRIPYPKVVYSAKSYPYDFVVQVKEFEKHNQVGQLHLFADYQGNRYYEKNFDLIAWLNQREK